MAKIKLEDFVRAVQADPVMFRNNLVIDVNGVPRPLRECLDPWQRADFAALDPSWKRVAGQDVQVQYRRGWLERPRGHSKTSDLAVMIAWALLASPLPIRGIAAAVDLEQAGLLRNAIQKLIALNPWLRKFLEAQDRRVVNPSTESCCTFITSDVASSHGQIADFIIADELTHWAKRDLWDILFSTAAKRPKCLLLVICNAGFRESWQWPFREGIREDPSWYFSRLDGPVASWITAEDLAEQERHQLPLLFRRLWLNEWSSGSGDALSESDILAAIDEDMALVPTRDEVCCAGLDLGIKHDASALVTVAKSSTGGLRVLRVRRWKAPRDGKVDLAEVEAAVLQDWHEFRLRRITTDPWETAYMLQRLKRAGSPAFGRQQANNNLVEQACSLVENFRNGTIRIPRHDQLLSELRGARIEERRYGVRLCADRDESGHGDIVSALSIALAEIKTVGPAVYDLTGWDPQDEIVKHLLADNCTRYKPARGMSFLPRARLGGRF